MTSARPSLAFPYTTSSEQEKWVYLDRLQDSSVVVIASFPGPAQLFITCSMEKRGEHEDDVIDKWQKIQNDKAKFHILFNKLQVQRSLCITVAPH